MSPSNDSPSSADRRQEVGLRFDPASGQLQIGTFSVTLAAGVGNREVLNAYVELAARSRGDRVANLVDIRQADVDALALALDLDAVGLDAEIEAVLGATRAAALTMVSRLRESRVIGGLTKAATGAVLAGSLVAGGSVVTGGSDSGALRRHAAEAAPAMAKQAAPPVPEAAWDPAIDGQGAEAGQEIGLIPPASIDIEGVELIAPATEDQGPTPGS